MVIDLLSNDQDVLRDQINNLATLLASSPDFTSKPIPQADSVKDLPEIADENQRILTLIDKVGYAKEDLRIVVLSDRGKTHIPRRVSAGPISSPVPIHRINLDQFTTEGLKYMSDVANALGMDERHGSFTRLSIGPITRALTDHQTRPAMKEILNQHPDAAKTVWAGTNYYIFGDSVGKIIELPAPLLTGRAFPGPLANRATSEMTSGDEFLLKVTLRTLETKLRSY